MQFIIIIIITKNYYYKLKYANLKQTVWVFSLSLSLAMCVCEILLLIKIIKNVVIINIERKFVIFKVIG